MDVPTRAPFIVLLKYLLLQVVLSIDSISSSQKSCRRSGSGGMFGAEELSAWEHLEDRLGMAATIIAGAVGGGMMMRRRRRNRAWP
ncbi:unnamed protein product [Sphagnum troendelagicum]|uniref:Uncharacterized protein n=1 Tax=Sphagnum troendelagicum TaxID=128251 RepID=A0ABP0TA18_9BRYO